MCIRKNVGRGWFVILMICRYGEMFVVVGILVIYSRECILLVY
jgi:hypothetical protein